LLGDGGDAVTRRWTLRFAAGFGVLTVLVSGCTEKQQANESLPSASTTSASASPDELPPLGPEDFPMPDEARTRTKQGVVAFSSYYFSLSNHLLKTLDSAPLRELSQDCELCNDLADAYDHDRAAGYIYEGGNISISSTGSAVVNGRRAEISFVLQQEAVTVRDRNGAVVDSKSSEPYELTGGMGLVWDDDRATWLVKQLDAERL
jgi:Family of unknown function (DUF6318)